MKTKQLVLFLFLISGFVLSAQTQPENQIYYSRYEGTVDSNIQITANIVRLKENLSGNYSYYHPGVENNNEHSSIFSIVGEIADNEYNFKKYGNNDLLLTGYMNQKSFEGKWYYDNSNDILFNIPENYPLGSMQFDVHYLHSEDQLIKNQKDSPVAEMELTLIYPFLKSNETKEIDSVCHHIAESFFGSDFFDISPDSMLTHFENEYYQNYVDQNADRYDSGASFNWQKIVSMSVINNSDYLLCLEFLKYAYAGGAHGMTNISYQNIDLTSGISLIYNDVFTNDTTGTLSKILTNKLYSDKKIPEDITLKEAGYFVDSIEPNHNIYINNTGIGFMYNSYEIAPYSFGQTSVFLEYDKIKHLIKKESPVFKLIK